MESFATRAAAEGFIASCRTQAQGRTVKAAIDEFVLEAKERGLAASSIERIEYRLAKILGGAVNAGRPLRWIEKRGAELYVGAKTGAVDTHRLDLTMGKTFGAWCVGKGWISVNPFAGIKGTGRKKRGKPQLRIDEARKLVDHCLAVGDAPALAVATAFLLGMRASEVTARTCRDLDDRGRLLWITASKTETGKRVLEVPEVLRPLLVALAKGRKKSAPLFGDDVAPSRYWLHYHCARLCRAAGVPVVPPHGLRGTQATIATTAGSTAQVVAAALGHASASTTEAHYLDAGEVAASKRRAAWKVLDGGKQPTKIVSHGAREPKRSKARAR